MKGIGMRVNTIHLQRGVFALVEPQVELLQTRRESEKAGNKACIDVCLKTLLGTRVEHE